MTHRRPQLQCWGILMRSSGEKLSRELHAWHAKVTALMSSSPKMILRSALIIYAHSIVTLRAAGHGAAADPLEFRQGTGVFFGNSAIEVLMNSR